MSEEDDNEKLVVQELQNVKFETPTKYKLDYIIGQGAYGIVVRGIDKTLNEEDAPVAIKKNVDVFSHDKTYQMRILRELMLLHHFDHENIISIRDVILPKSFKDFKDVYFVTDLMDTDLRRIIKSDQTLSNDHIQYFMYQILRGLKAIHTANVLHRDLKPANILVNSDCDLKICDFGLSRGVDFEINVKVTTYVATRWYRAPELLLQYDKPTKSIDIWSCGCIFAELLNRRVLFPGKDYLKQIDLIMQVIGTPPKRIIVGSDQAQRYMESVPKYKKQNFKKLCPTANSKALDLLNKMLVWDHNKRIKVEEALSHEYFGDLREPEDEPSAPIFDFSYEKKAESSSIKSIIYTLLSEWANEEDDDEEDDDESMADA